MSNRGRLPRVPNYPALQDELKRLRRKALQHLSKSAKTSGKRWEVPEPADEAARPLPESDQEKVEAERREDEEKPLRGHIFDGFRHGFARVWGQAIWFDVRNGEWGLGTTQEEVATSLGVNRSTISNGEREGIMTFPMLAFLLYVSGQEPEDFRSLPPVGQMVRGGSIEALRRCRLLLRYSTSDRRKRSADQLKMWEYELLLRIYGDCYKEWKTGTILYQLGELEPQKRENYFKMISTIVREVAALKDAIPVERDGSKSTEEMQCIDRLLADPKRAVVRLAKLQKHWHEAWILTADLLSEIEGLRNDSDT